jgi:hypothetical protein
MMLSGRKIWHWIGKSIFKNRFAWLLIIINAALFAFLLSPLLFGERYVNHTDARLFSYPFLALFDARIGSMDVLWNDLSGAGFPSLYIHGFVFNPLLWLLLAVTGPIDALHWQMFLHAWLASCLVGIALLRMQYRPSAAWLGSVLTPLMLWTWLFEPTIAVFLPLLGAACVAISIMDTRPRTAAIGYGCITASAFLMLQSHYAAILFGIMILLWIARRATLGARYHPTRTDIICMIAIACGLFISLLRILPLMGYAALSTRMGEFLESYISTSSISIGYAFRFLFATSPLPVPDSFAANTPFVGIGVLTLAVVGLLKGRRQWMVWTALAVWAFTVTLALPSSPTFFLLKLLPGIAQLGDPTRYLIAGQLALVALAVEGVQNVALPAPGRAVHRWAMVVFAVSTLLLVVGLVIPIVEPAITSLLLSLRNPEMIILTIGGLCMGGLLYASSREHVVRWTVPLMSFVAVGIAVSGYTPMYDVDTGRIALEFTPPTTTILTEQNATIFPFLVDSRLRGTSLHLQNPELYNLGSQALGVPNTTLLGKLRNITMFDHIQSKRLDSLLAGIGSEYSHVHTASGAAQPTIEQLQQQLLDRWHVLERIGITHVLTPEVLPGREEMMNSLLFPEILMPDETGVEVTVQESLTMHVYPVANARSRFSAAQEVLTQEPDQETARARVLDPESSMRTVIECVVCPLTAMQGEITIAQRRESSVFTSAHVRTDAPRWIVVRRQLLPGWRVRVDGQPVQPAIADSIFIAVPVTAGDHEIAASFSVWSMIKDSIWLLLSPTQTPWFS